MPRKLPEEVVFVLENCSPHPSPVGDYFLVAFLESGFSMGSVKQTFSMVSVILFLGKILCFPAGLWLIANVADFPLNEAQVAWQKNRDMIAKGTECQVDLTIEVRARGSGELKVESKAMNKFAVTGKRQLYVSMDQGGNPTSLEAINENYWFTLECSASGTYSLENITPISAYLELQGSDNLRPCRELLHGTQCLWVDLEDVLGSHTATWSEIRNGETTGSADGPVEYSMQGEVVIDDYTKLVGGTIAFLDSRTWLSSQGTFKAMAKSKNGVWTKGEIRTNTEFTNYMNIQFSKHCVLEFDFPDIGLRRYTYDFKDVNRISAETGTFFLSDYGMREPEFDRGKSSRFWKFLIVGVLAFSVVAVGVWMRRS